MKSYCLKSKRKAVRKIAEARFLRQKRGKFVGKILRECPDIGKTIESYVWGARVGADSWQRTGLLTFDGNRKVNKKATFARIKEHLQKAYKRKFGCRSVVQLCVARNKRKQSAKCYKAVANVICRRARKGFMLQFNPEQYWSVERLNKIMHSLRKTNIRHQKYHPHFLYHIHPLSRRIRSATSRPTSTPLEILTNSTWSPLNGLAIL